MKNYCGADCESCAFGSKCRGCTETCGSPFDGRCIAAEYIKTGGKAAYEEYKSSLVKEASAELVSLGLKPTHFTSLSASTLILRTIFPAEKK